MARTVIAATALILLGACFGGDPNVTESGKGLPVVTIEFPETAPPGSVQTAALEVSNPGPGNMSSLTVAFTLIGRLEGVVPRPIVEIGYSRRNPAIVEVEPPPRAISFDGVRYVFDGLDEDASKKLRFRLKLPDAPGLAGNAVVVSDGQDPERARGVPLRTMVEG